MRAGRAAFAAAVLSVGCLALTWGRRNLVVITVRGDSMRPAYRNGQRLIVWRGGYRAGEAVVFRSPSPQAHQVDWLVKRAAAVAGEPVPADLQGPVAVLVVPPGQLLVRSDAPNGLDSRRLGLINDRDVLGVVRYPRPRDHGRTRTVPPRTEAPSTAT